MTTPLTLEQMYAAAALHRAKQLEEYGTWVATRQIMFGAVPAFNPGDPVPVSHVEKYGWDKTGDVTRRESTPGDVTAGSLPNVGSDATGFDAPIPKAAGSASAAAAAPAKSATNAKKGDADSGNLRSASR